ncbi:hypothetical protein AAY473_023394 [Plecturocebus cupreus]
MELRCGSAGPQGPCLPPGEPGDPGSPVRPLGSHQRDADSEAAEALLPSGLSLQPPDIHGAREPTLDPEALSLRGPRAPARPLPLAIVKLRSGGGQGQVLGALQAKGADLGAGGSRAEDEGLGPFVHPWAGQRLSLCRNAKRLLRQSSPGRGPFKRGWGFSLSLGTLPACAPLRKPGRRFLSNRGVVVACGSSGGVVRMRVSGGQRRQHSPREQKRSGPPSEQKLRRVCSQQKSRRPEAAAWSGPGKATAPSQRACAASRNSGKRKRRLGGTPASRRRGPGEPERRGPSQLGEAVVASI